MQKIIVCVLSLIIIVWADNNIRTNNVGRWLSVTMGRSSFLALFPPCLHSLREATRRQPGAQSSF